MGLDNERTHQPKRRATLNEVIRATCGPLHDEILRAFGLELRIDEIVAFAKLNKCENDKVSLAEHVCYILVHAYREENANIAGLHIHTKVKIQKLLQLEEDNDDVKFDDSLLVEPKVDPTIHRLALDFLNK